MGHSLGVSDSYVRFTEEQILEDYLQIVDYLTVNQTIVLINKSLRKQEETIKNSLKELEERHRKEMKGLHEEYELEIKTLKEEMENKFKEIFIKIDLSRIWEQK